MAEKIAEELREWIRSEKVDKALATVGKDGEVEVTFNGAYDIDEKGRILYFELLETAQTNRNLTYALWFGRKVAVLFRDGAHRSYVVKGVPTHDIVTGPLFEAKYREFLEADPENDLAGIWIIEPEEVREDTEALLRHRERTDYPIIGHIDRDVGVR